MSFRGEKIQYYRNSLLSLLGGAKEVANSPGLFLCTIFKDEAPYLKEWMDFHLDQGFDKIFLLNNGSGDDFRKVLQPYQERGVAELRNTRTNESPVKIQGKEYNYTIREIRKEFGGHNWVAFTDLDEYLFSASGKSIKAELNKFRGTKTGTVLVNWLVFGTSEIEQLEEDKPMIHQLVRRAPDEHDEHRVYKSISYAANIFRFGTGVHKPFLKGRAREVYSDGTVFEGVQKNIHYPLRINHYWYRDEKYYREKKKKRRAFFGYERSDDMEKWHKDRCNRVEDKTIIFAASRK